VAKTKKHIHLYICHLFSNKIITDIATTAFSSHAVFTMCSVSTTLYTISTTNNN